MIWNFAIRRPVFTLVIFLVIAIFGVWGATHMPLREDPEIDFPIVSVSVVLPGGDPDVIETEVIEPLESEINTIEGLKEIQSTARPEVGVITAEFELWRNIDIATQDVRDRIERARRNLPQDIEAPLVQKIDPDAFPIMWITLTGNDRWDPVRMTDYARNVLKERLESLRGVGQVLIGGARAYAVRIRLDPERLAARGLTVDDVVRAIQQNNVDIPSGRVESTSREFLVDTRGQFSSPEPFNRIVVARPEGRVVRLSDVGEAVAAVENDRQLARFSGVPTVGLGVVKQSDANLVALADALQDRMARLAESFPPGLEYTVAVDDSTFVRDSLRDLAFTIVVATLLVVFVVLAFLRSGRGTIITSLAIPTSLLAGTAFMYVLGFSLNTITMMGLILVIGIVVDDAIVVLESVYRHMEHGAERIAAARTGTTEVAFAAIANTAALAAVFIPVAFTRGIIGRYLYEFGLTIALTVFASTFVALTLTPMLSSRILGVSEHHGAVWRASERALEGIEAAYARTLGLAMRHRGLTIVAGLGAVVLGGFLFSRLSTQFAPDTDRSGFVVSFETPQGATLRTTDAYAAGIEAAMRSVPEIEHAFLAIGLSQAGPGLVNEGVAFVHLSPPGERERSQSEVMQALREKIDGLPEGRAFVYSGGGMGGGPPLQIVLQSPDLDALATQQDALMAWMRREPEYVGVSSDLKLEQPEVAVRVDRDKASQMGVSVADVANTLRYLLGEPTISYVERGGERYDVITEAGARGRMVPDALRSIWVRTAEGGLVSLGNVVRLQEGVGPSEIHHYDRIRAATISASTPPGVPLGTAVDKVEAHLSQVLPADFDHTVTGEAQQLQESFGYLTTAVAFSVVFVFLILAAQFESFLHPFTILLSLPLAIVGAFGGLWLLGMPFDVYAFIGLIMLFGMATKNAILLVDYANVLVARGRRLREAAAEASHTRLRPVLMTAFSTILGILPIAIGLGAGGEARRALGVVVDGGLIAATFLTLVVVPVVYTVFGDVQARLRRRRRPAPAVEVDP